MFCDRTFKDTNLAMLLRNAMPQNTYGEAMLTELGAYDKIDDSKIGEEQQLYDFNEWFLKGPPEANVSDLKAIDESTLAFACSKSPGPVCPPEGFLILGETKKCNKFIELSKCSLRESGKRIMAKELDLFYTMTWSDKMYTKYGILPVCVGSPKAISEYELVALWTDIFSKSFIPTEQRAPNIFVVPSKLVNEEELLKKANIPAPLRDRKNLSNYWDKIKKKAKLMAYQVCIYCHFCKESKSDQYTPKECFDFELGQKRILHCCCGSELDNTSAWFVIGKSSEVCLNLNRIHFTKDDVHEGSMERDVLRPKMYLREALTNSKTINVKRIPFLVFFPFDYEKTTQELNLSKDAQILFHGNLNMCRVPFVKYGEYNEQLIWCLAFRGELELRKVTIGEVELTSTDDWNFYLERGELSDLIKSFVVQGQHSNEIVDFSKFGNHRYFYKKYSSMKRGSNQTYKGAEDTTAKTNESVYGKEKLQSAIAALLVSSASIDNDPVIRPKDLGFRYIVDQWNTERKKVAWDYRSFPSLPRQIGRKFYFREDMPKKTMGTN